ncbi:dihydrolipoyl dehydrogenase family protein [Novispirillum sp. DQ9]|uniref:dihydrolipoyl dehydrogenase family protein n=1 Tax=Novispirillum sp. DQ9 TaxID=3398612 RepID=UPI003C7D2D24
MTLLEADVCVIGAGSGGLSVAAGAAQLGVRTVLVERGAMGGDCLNTGCVPSKALLAAAHAAQAARDAAALGVVARPEIDFAAVHRHVHGAIAAIAPHDSQERFEGLGVTVLREDARFLDARTLRAGAVTVRARRFVLATGSRPLVPDLPGLARVPFLTNETVFTLTERPRHLIVLGGGPIGCELAQAFRRLGAQVTLVARSRLLPREDPDLGAMVAARLRREGVEVREHASAHAVEPDAEGVALAVGGHRLTGSHLLVATGRRPTVEGLGLEAAGVVVEARGVRVDGRLRTSNRRIFAVGDVAGQGQFTHLAGHHAARVVRAMLFRLPGGGGAAIPRVTYTDPELAQVGLTESQARAEHGDGVRVLAAPFADNDRARCEARTDGLLKVVTTRRGRVLGAGIVGAAAGDLLVPWILAVDGVVPLRALAGMVVPYPTRGEVTKRAAGAYYKESLFSPRSRAVVRFLMGLTRR